MSNPATQSDRVNFLKLVIDSAEKRRDSVENKASILIASNAILLTAMASLIPSLANPGAGSTNPYGWIPIGLGALTLVSVVVSTMSAIGILVSVRGDRQRNQVLDIGEDEMNLFYFSKVAERSKADYLAAIQSMTDQAILEQLTAEAHNISRLARQRYQLLYFSHRAFMVSVALFLSVMMGLMIFR